MTIRVVIMSDLHLEIDRKRGIQGPVRAVGHPRFGPDLRRLRGKVDLCILAGDIDRGVDAIDYAGEVAGYLSVPTVFVAGNHEFYHHRHDELVAGYRTISSATGGRVRFLENEETTIWLKDTSCRVLGCTLWTDLALYGRRAARELASSGNLLDIYDYQRIRNSDDELISVGDPVAWHQASRAWLADVIGDGAPPTIVVTHHAISLRSIAPHFEGSPLNATFTSDLEELVRQSRASLWVHGHTHHDIDYRLGSTRVVSRQRGYPMERNEQFEPLVLEL